MDTNDLFQVKVGVDVASCRTSFCGLALFYESYFSALKYEDNDGIGSPEFDEVMMNTKKAKELAEKNNVKTYSCDFFYCHAKPNSHPAGILMAPTTEVEKETEQHRNAYTTFVICPKDDCLFIISRINNSIFSCLSLGKDLKDFLKAWRDAGSILVEIKNTNYSFTRMWDSALEYCWEFVTRRDQGICGEEFNIPPHLRSFDIGEA